MDIEKLLKALDNEENKKLLNLTTQKIKDMKLEILKELDLPSTVLIDYMKKLKDYMYVDEMDELRHGAFIRWIVLSDPNNLFLTPGGIICEIKVTDTGMAVVCKNYAHKHFHIKIEECLIFQKMSSQEQVLLSALDHLAK
jgi:hypothetical protein